NGIAIQDAHVVVGGYNDDNVYVYDLAGATPTVPVFTLRNPTQRITDHFGSTVAISGTRVVIGAYTYETTRYGEGIAYVYDLTAAVPMLPVMTLTNPSPAA